MSGMYAAMVIAKLESFETKSGTPLKNEMPGLLGVILVFDNEAQAKQHGLGHVLELGRAES